MAFTNRERTILGDLTTVFTPPAPCTVAIGQCATCNAAWWGQTCAPTTVQDDPGCWPATTQGAPEPGLPLFGYGFYSPGLECPAGYASACTAIAGKTSAWKVQFQMEAEETFVGCCPTGFKCANLNGQTCIMGAKSTVLPTVSCEGGSSNNFGFTTLPNAQVTNLNLFAPMIQLAWRSSDRSTTTSDSSTSTSASATSAPTTGLPDPTPQNEANPSEGATSSSAPLSTGAVAGIAVGAAALFLLILAAAIFVWRRRRNQTTARQPMTDGGSSPPEYNPDGYSSVAAGSPQSETKLFPHHHHYAAAATVSEIGQGHERFEAPGEGHGPAEVPGQGHGRAEIFAGHQQVPVPGAGYPNPGLPPAYGPVEMPAQRYY